MPKFFKLLLVGVMLAALLGACSGSKEPAYDILEYLSAFTTMDYAAMFDCTEAAVENTGDDYDAAKEAFVSKYTAIFTGIGVKEITIENLVGPDADGGYTYTATYKTTDYGDFTNNFVLETCMEDNMLRALGLFADLPGDGGGLRCARAHRGGAARGDLRGGRYAARREFIR